MVRRTLPDLARVGLSQLPPYQGGRINELWHHRSNLLWRAPSLEPARIFRQICVEAAV
jgi:hypothetical protein